MATLWGFESLPGHQATLNADCPEPSIKTKTYTPGARQLHAQRKNSSSPRTTRGILSALLPFGSSHVTCGRPSLPPISSHFQIVQQRFACFLSGRRSRAAARQHCSTFCSMFLSMPVVHTRPCIALRVAATVRAPVWRPQTSARTRQRLPNRVISNPNCVLNLCAHPGNVRAGQLSSAFSDVHLIEPRPQTVPKPMQPDAAAINPPSIRYDTRRLQAFWISGAADFRRFGFPALSGASKASTSKANGSQDLIILKRMQGKAKTPVCAISKT